MAVRAVAKSAATGWSAGAISLLLAASQTYDAHDARQQEQALRLEQSRATIAVAERVEAARGEHLDLFRKWALADAALASCVAGREYTADAAGHETPPDLEAAAAAVEIEPPSFEAEEHRTQGSLESIIELLSLPNSPPAP